MNDFEEVAVQYAPMISAMIRKLHIHRDYDTFRQIGNIALWQAWQRFEDEKGHFTPFAYRSIRGAMLDELKRETKRTNQASLLGSVLIEEGIEEVMETLPEWLIIKKLDANEKWLLEALFVQGYSLSNLADQQDISLAGMKKRRERLLKKVRAAIDHPFKT